LTQLAPKARVARGATYLFIQGFANSLLGVVFFIVLARALSDHPEEMGIFALLVFVLSLPLTLGTFALSSASVKYISQYVAGNNLDKAKSVVTRVLQVGLLSSAVAFVLLFIPAEWLSTFMFKTADYTLILRIVALASVFNLFYVLASGFLQGLQKMREVAAIGIGYTVVQYSVTVLLLYLGWRLYAVAYGWLTGLSIFSLAGLIITAKHLGVFGKPHKIKPLFQFSLPLYAAGGIGYFIGWIDQLILVSYMGLLYGATEAQRILGIYYVAIRAATVPGLFSSSIVTALFPQLSELYTQQGFNSLRDAFRVSARYSVLIGFPLVVGLTTLARPAIILFAGFKYIEAVDPLIIISIAALVGTLGVAIGPILMTLERTNLVSLLSIVSLVLSVFLSYFSLAYLGLGMIGTAWARTIASIIGLVLSLYVLKRHIPISFDKEALWKASVASALI
jgi:O-antigen/teichoic acid export membrane protein